MPGKKPKIYWGTPSSVPQPQQRAGRPPHIYLGRSEPAPSSLEDTQTAIPAKDRQSEAKRQKATQEPVRYQPSQGQSRLGKRLVRDMQTGEYTQTGDYVDVTQAFRREGLYLLGLQGYGKSGLIENLIIQDIKQHIGVCVLDPHGELIDHVIARLPDEKAEAKVILLDITEKDFFLGLNLFECSDPTSDREIHYTLNQATHVFEKAFGITRANPRLYDYLYNSAYTLIANPGYTMMDIRLLLTNPTCRSTLLGNVTDADVLDFWQKYYNPLPARQQREEAREILRRLNDLTHDPLRYIIGQSQSTINLQEIMDEGKILLVKLNSKRFEEATRLIGSILVALTLNASDVRLTKKQFNLYADEFQRFATEDFATLIEEARKAAIGITMAHQNRGQLELSEKQADANLKRRTLSVGNLVVFRVPTDANELAGQFAQEPEAARIEVQKPQQHERIEEQVEVEVEEDIEEISQNPVDFLVGARGSHTSTRVREGVRVITPLLARKWYGKTTEDVKNFLNALLVDVMEGRMKPETATFAERIEEIVRECFAWVKFPSDEIPTYKEKLYELHRIVEQCQSDFIRELVLGQNPDTKARLRHELIETTIRWQVFEAVEEEEFRLKEENGDYKLPSYQDEFHSRLRSYQERCEAALRAGKGIGYRQPIYEAIDEVTKFVTNFHILSIDLAADPIKVPTGQKRLVKRKQPYITYLTHESEKITHQQPSEQEMTNRMVRELINLPLYTARVKITTAAGTEEHLIRTLEPEKGIRGTTLQERIDRIREHNRTPDERGIRSCRPKQEVEAEIIQRQEQYHEPAEEQPEDEPPISRRQRT